MQLEDSTLEKVVVFPNSTTFRYICSGRKENITRVPVEAMFNAFKVLTPVPMCYRQHPSPLITPAPSLQTLISCRLPDYMKKTLKRGLFCSINEGTLWDLSSARSLDSLFGKYTQGLAEITAASPLQLAHCYVCCQQKLSGQVNGSYQAAESTSH